MPKLKRTKIKKHIQPLFKSVPQGLTATVPGSPIYIGDKEASEAAFSVIQYNNDEVSFITPEHIEEILSVLDTKLVNWININGLADQDAIKRLGGFFKLDALTIEDVFNTEHRPKIEDFGHYLLLIIKMLTRRPDDSIEYEQVAIIITKNTLITIQESPGDCFGPIRERLKTGAGRLRKFGSSFLAYALIDVIVDNYFSLLEWIGTQLDDFEAASISSRDANAFMEGLQSIKSELNKFRRVLWPIREIVIELSHSESKLIEKNLSPFFRDLHENSVQVLEAIESYRETVSGIQEVFLSSVSNKMNEVMKVLTIISTIFIPLTFIAGVYGMNFKYMPELEAKIAYPVTWLVMLAIAVGMIFYFKKKKWF